MKSHSGAHVYSGALSGGHSVGSEGISLARFDWLGRISPAEPSSPTKGIMMYDVSPLVDLSIFALLDGAFFVGLPQRKEKQ